MQRYMRKCLHLVTGGSVWTPILSFNEPPYPFFVVKHCRFAHLPSHIHIDSGPHANPPFLYPPIRISIPFLIAVSNSACVSVEGTGIGTGENEAGVDSWETAPAKFFDDSSNLFDSNSGSNKNLDDPDSEGPGPTTFDDEDAILRMPPPPPPPSHPPKTLSNSPKTATLNMQNEAPKNWKTP